MRLSLLLAVAVGLFATPPVGWADVPVDLTEFDPASGISVRQQGTRLEARWPLAEHETGVLILELHPQRPLIAELGIAAALDAASAALVRDIQPVTWLTVGSRDLSAQGWNVFFDNPPTRAHETFLARLDKERVRVSSHGRRTTIRISALSAGSFAGDLCVTLYAGCRLVHVEAVLSTRQDACAIL
ncbi:MAG: hypothetical protein JSS02_03155, partial [Planctomycetes bacterium]|nr:hypothetical protein [Planctomycetota bacterium]